MQQGQCPPLPAGADPVEAEGSWILAGQVPASSAGRFGGSVANAPLLGLAQYVAAERAPRHGTDVNPWKMGRFPAPSAGAGQNAFVDQAASEPEPGSVRPKERGLRRYPSADTGWTPREFFDEHDTAAGAEPPAPAPAPEPESSAALWLTGTLETNEQPPAQHYGRNHRPPQRRIPPREARPPPGARPQGGRQPAPGPAAAHPLRSYPSADSAYSAYSARDATNGWAPLMKPLAAPANGRRQGTLSARGADTPASTLSSFAPSDLPLTPADKAIKIIRSILQSWQSSSIGETFSRIGEPQPLAHDASRLAAFSHRWRCVADTLQSGRIGPADLETFLRSRLHLNFDRETVAEIVARFSDGGEGIPYPQFRALVLGDAAERGEDAAAAQGAEREDVTRNAEMLLRHRIRESGDDLRQIFSDVDRSGRGALSHDDLRFALHLFGVVMPEVQFQRLLKAMDRRGNNDGLITLPEFLAYFQQNTVDKELAVSTTTCHPPSPPRRAAGLRPHTHAPLRAVRPSSASRGSRWKPRSASSARPSSTKSAARSAPSRRYSRSSTLTAPARWTSTSSSSSSRGNAGWSLTRSCPPRSW